MIKVCGAPIADAAVSRIVDHLTATIESSRIRVFRNERLPE